MVIFNASQSELNHLNLPRQLLRNGVIEMLRNQIILHRYSLFAMLLLLSTVVVQAQSGGGVDTNGNGGRHSVSGRLIFPSGQRLDYRLKIRLESTGQGDM